MEQNYNDAQAADFYEDPQRRSIDGKEPVRRSDQGLTTHVPIRFNPRALAEIRDLAAKDGLTVSAWIRQACEDEIERRRPPELSTVSDAAQGEFSFRYPVGDDRLTATG